MRREKVVTINDRGQDKTFRIKEMPATQAERWIIRAGLALAGSGVIEKAVIQNDAGEAAVQIGKLLATQGLFSALGSVDFAVAEPLLNELMGCCYYVVNGAMDQRLTPDVIDGIVEDVKTLFLLKKEAAALNFDFFAQGGLSHTQPSEAKEPQSERRGAKISVS